jgi:1,4-alpha-glucan branching enzyme
MHQIAAGTCGDPFAVLGIQSVANGRVVRTFQPQARRVHLLNAKNQDLGAMTRAHSSGLFTTSLPPRLRHYRLRIYIDDERHYDIEDPYRFPSPLGELDQHLLGEGSHQRIYDTLGSHCRNLLGCAGVSFAVWAPNAARVSVVGPFNDWDGRRHVMRFHPGTGVWDIFMPDLAAGTLYKFELLDKAGKLLPLKTDPLARYLEPPPGNASIVHGSDYQWQDSEWQSRKRGAPNIDRPISIYEVHLGSWRRGAHGDFLGYRQLAEQLIPYVSGLGFTHIELLPVTEHPFDGSWGYQPIGLYASTQRFGNPDEFRFFVDSCHQAGLAVITDWVPAHFPRDEHGLTRFDGTALYEHQDPRLGEHADWGTLIFNYGRREVINYLIGSALFWIDEFHIDGLRVDAVASMLYLDYSRKAGEWLPNKDGGNENLEAVSFLKQLNEVAHAHGAETFAEESTAWPGVSRPVYAGGLGFTFKWNMGWMNDTLRYMSEDPIHRKFHHDKMTFGMVYATHENFVLPLSHDEVVHGKRSILGRMPGDEWQRFANLRAYYAFMFGHPGKKLLFMGDEFGQLREWDHDSSLDWDLLDADQHRGVQRLVRDLNLLYCSVPALHELDYDASGFEWADWQSADISVLAFLRFDRQGRHALCVTNFTPVVRYDYRVGVPAAGSYRERLNTDAADYGGSGVGNMGAVLAKADNEFASPASMQITLPPLATVLFTPAQD